MANEIKDQAGTIGVGNLGNVVKQLVKLQIEVVSIPFSLLPTDSRRYALDAVRQAFKAVRSIVDDVSDTIDTTLQHNIDRAE
ncbi:MAG: hypothetical protein WCS37_11145 [Chloroflexota bacterium]|nr:hypothetical protein [Chloroflexota bacterium]